MEEVSAVGRDILDPQWLTIVLGIIGFLINIVVLAVGFTWKITRVEGSMRQDMAAFRDELKSEIARESRLIGEAMQGLRQKVNDVELEAAQTFVRRDSWHQAMNNLQAQMQAQDKADDERALRMETKIDRIADAAAQRDERIEDKLDKLADRLTLVTRG